MDNTVTFTHPDGDLIFTFRDGSTPAALAVYDDVVPRLEGWTDDPDAPREVRIARARQFGKALFPDEEATQKRMRVILSGPHEKINWFLDAPWPRLVSIAADWLTRAGADALRAHYEEADRLERVAARVKGDE